jgi:hypothetical protein
VAARVDPDAALVWPVDGAAQERDRVMADGGAEQACPECKGERGYLGPVECVAMYEHEDMDDCGCPRSWTPCRVCGGSGELVGLARSVYIARGGAAPVQLRGYS